MSKLTTLIDCDGVLANWAKMFVFLCKNYFGIQISDENKFDHFEIPEIKEYKDLIWKRLLSTPELIRDLEKFEHTDELLQKLREIGDVICVTSVVALDDDARKSVLSSYDPYGDSPIGVPQIPYGGYYASERVSWLKTEAGFDRTDIIMVIFCA